ncbi:hypothetical protein J2X14_002993 [Pantoea alhagi]|nr:hypothetical protein [Pantoea alhagi]
MEYRHEGVFVRMTTGKSFHGRAGSNKVAGLLQTNRGHCIYSAPFFYAARFPAAFAVLCLPPLKFHPL